MNHRLREWKCAKLTKRRLFETLFVPKPGSGYLYAIHAQSLILDPGIGAGVRRSVRDVFADQQTPMQTTTTSVQI